MRRPRDRQEVVILVSALAVLALTWAFVLVAGQMSEGNTRALDERLLHALVLQEASGSLRGPSWLLIGVQDITSLGSPVVLGLTVLAVTGYLWLHRRYRYGLFILLATVGGWWLQWALKAFFERARPDTALHLRDVLSSSFPSGHAVTSAAVYLTLGALLMRAAEGRLAKYYCIAVAMGLTFLVGSSRVLLGVHYPSDVVGGWLIGMSWALGCWTVERFLEHRAGLRKEALRSNHR